jgi:hypothetical protein
VVSTQHWQEEVVFGILHSLYQNKSVHLGQLQRVVFIKTKPAASQLALVLLPARGLF